MRLSQWCACLAALGSSTGSPVSRPLPALSASPRQITVVARDYTFEVPDTVLAGPTSFRLENRGRMDHEVVLFTARRGVSAAMIVAAPAGEARRHLGDPPIAILFAPTAYPISADLLVTLQPGRWYVLFCGLQDTKEMPFHYAIGMMDSIYVR